jgi:hypothetical protein
LHPGTDAAGFESFAKATLKNSARSGLIYGGYKNMLKANAYKKVVYKFVG